MAKKAMIGWILGWFLLGGGIFSALGAQTSESTYPLEEIRRGQRGYGLSVFAGHEPERFEFEVLGTVQNLSPGVSYVLATLEGQDLEASGVVAGMSGSPVWIEGQLVGAVAFSWNFAQKAIAGITPIHLMRELPHGTGVGSAFLGGSDPRIADFLQPETVKKSFEEALAALRPPAPENAASALGWSAGGFTADTRAYFGSFMGSMSPTGQSAALAPELTGGSSMAAVLVDGDLRMAATGTVTERRDDEIVGFGHPFMGLGDVAIPLATSEVVTVMPSVANSFKIANIGNVIGMVDKDQLTGVHGVIGQMAPTLPLTVNIEADGIEKGRSFRMDLAIIPEITPVLVAISSMGSLGAVGEATGEQSLDMSLHYRLKNHEDLVIEQSFHGPGVPNSVASYLYAYSNYLFNNRFERLEIEGIEVDLIQQTRSRSLTLVDAFADRTEVEPGETVKIFLDLIAERGDRERRTLSITVPEDLPDGPYFIMLGDGGSMSSARLEILPTAPVTMKQALRILGQFRSSRDLVVFGLMRDLGLSVEGELLTQIPGSMAAIWAKAPVGTAQPLHFVIAQEETHRYPVPLIGAARIDLQVKK